MIQSEECSAKRIIYKSSALIVIKQKQIKKELMNDYAKLMAETYAANLDHAVGNYITVTGALQVLDIFDRVPMELREKVYAEYLALLVMNNLISIDTDGKIVYPCDI